MGGEREREDLIGGGGILVTPRRLQYLQANMRQLKFWEQLNDSGTTWKNRIREQHESLFSPPWCLARYISIWTASERRGNSLNVSRTFATNPRPESGPDCLTCATFARQQKLHVPCDNMKCVPRNILTFNMCNRLRVWRGSARAEDFKGHLPRVVCHRVYLSKRIEEGVGGIGAWKGWRTSMCTQPHG